MPEFIERSKAIKELHDAYEYEYPTASGAFDEFASTIVPNVLRNIPAADVVEVVHSKWIKRNNERRCPVCDFFYLTSGTTIYNLCPMCGAKMDGSDINVTTNNGWISVEDRLPDNPMERVLVHIKEANGIMGLPNIDTDRYLEDDWVRWPENVTHWQPLPEPPKGSD